MVNACEILKLVGVPSDSVGIMKLEMSCQTNKI